MVEITHKQVSVIILFWFNNTQSYKIFFYFFTFFGRARGADPRFPFNLRKATTDPDQIVDVKYSDDKYQ